MLTGEYAVLDGALALTIPTKFGQLLKIVPSVKKGISWKSYNHNGNIWFETQFEGISDTHAISNEPGIKNTLISILSEAKKLNPDFLSSSTGIEAITSLEFPIDWGLGSSSTLINNIAQWAEVDAFQLLKNSFGGSGYDIAAAQSECSILYQWIHNAPKVKQVKLDWNFKEQLFFVHLNQKKSSKEGIRHYRKTLSNDHFISSISDLTTKIQHAPSLTEFEASIDAHEELISERLKLPRIKDILFKDYRGGCIKSLGAWGGDFILVSGNQESQQYFIHKGFETILSFREMSL